MSSQNDDPRFLTVDAVLQLHAKSVNRFGGSMGLRDSALLESAVAAPQQSAFGQLAHPTLHHQAAAYLFHIVKNHPFIDGNKRAGVFACLRFLALNGKTLTLSDKELYQHVDDVVKNRISKEQLAANLERNLQEMPFHHLAQKYDKSQHEQQIAEQRNEREQKEKQQNLEKGQDKPQTKKLTPWEKVQAAMEDHKKLLADQQQKEQVQQQDQQRAKEQQQMLDYLKQLKAESLEKEQALQKEIEKDRGHDR